MFISKNPSVIRSQNWIADALCLLMKENTFEKIQIKDIAKTADVSRQTFYKNFDSKDDVLLYKTRSVLARFFLEPLPKDNDLRQISHSFFAFCLTEQSYLSLLHKHHKVHLINEVVTEYILRFLSKMSLLDGYLSDDIRYAVSFLVGALTQMLDLWIHEDYKKSIEDLTKVMVSLLSGCAFDTVNQTLSFKNIKTV